MNKTEFADLSAIGERIALIVDRQFGNNQTAAATAWDVTLSVVNRVVHSQRLPNVELLFAIAQTENLNLDWLINGIGEPYYAVTEVLLPVFTEVLRQPIVDQSCSPALMFRNAVPSKYSDSRYWYHATKHSCMYDHRKERLDAQYLLIETNHDYIFDNLQDYACVCVQLTSGKPVFATIQPSTDGGITLEMKKSTPRSGAGGCDAFDLLEINTSWDCWDEETTLKINKCRHKHEVLGKAVNTKLGLPPEAWTIHLNNTKGILGLVIAREEDNG